MPRAADLSVAEDLGRRLQHGRGGVLARDPARRGGPARHARSSTRPTSTRRRCARPRPASIALDRSREFSAELPRARAARGSLSDYYTAAYDGASFDRRCARRCVFSDHSLATDTVFAEVQLVSCRNVLIYFDAELQDRAVGLFRDVAGAPRLPRPRLRRRACAFVAARARAFDRITGPTRTHLPKLRRDCDACARSHGSGQRDRRDRDRRIGRRHRCARACCSRRCPRVFVPAVLVVVHLPPRRAEDRARDVFAARCALPCARRSDKERDRSAAPSTSRPPDYHLLVERGQLVALSLDAPVHLLAPVDRRAVRVRGVGLRRAAARDRAVRRERGRRGRPRRDSRAGRLALGAGSRRQRSRDDAARSARTRRARAHVLSLDDMAAAARARSGAC